MVREGFRRQRLAVLPRPLVADAATRPITSTLQVTDAGWFPLASGHERARPQGCPETIVLLCVAGDGWVDIAGARQKVPARSFAVLPADTPHAYGSSATAPWTIWWMHVRGTLAPQMQSELGVAVRQIGEPDRVVELVEQIVTALERDPSRTNLVRASGLAAHVLALLAAPPADSESADPLRRAMSYLAERLDRPVQTADLARHALVSASHLGALFRAATGGGPMAYHATLRMARARQLLDGTELSISAVATATGYADALYFSRQFRRTHGLSPRAYRAQHKG